VYEAVVLPAPVALVQPVMPSAETCHWYAYALIAGAAAHVPVVQASGSLTFDVPVTAGAALFTGRPSVIAVAGAAAAGPAVAPTVVVTACALSCGINVPAGAPPAVAFENVTV
jgi:hypothetical protein